MEMFRIISYDRFVGFFRMVLVAALAVVFFTMAFFAAALAFVVAPVPVAAFFAGTRLAVVVVFLLLVALLAVDVFLGAALALVEDTFTEDAFLAAAVVRAVPVGLEAAADVAVVLGFAADFFATTGFFAVLVALVLAAVLDLVATDLVVACLPVVVLGVDLAVADLTFVVGLFSLVAEVSTALVFGASLTRPEGPLGRTNTPFSLPDVSALASRVFCAAPMTSLYLSSTNFLI